MFLLRCWLCGPSPWSLPRGPYSPFCKSSVSPFRNPLFWRLPLPLPLISNNPSLSAWKHDFLMSNHKVKHNYSSRVVIHGPWALFQNTSSLYILSILEERKSIYFLMSKWGLIIKYIALNIERTDWYSSYQGTLINVIQKCLKRNWIWLKITLSKRRSWYELMMKTINPLSQKGDGCCNTPFGFSLVPFMRFC